LVGRTGARNIEPFGFAQGELLLLVDSIIKYWKIGRFAQIILMKNMQITHRIMFFEANIGFAI